MEHLFVPAFGFASERAFLGEMASCYTDAGCESTLKPEPETLAGAAAASYNSDSHSTSTTTPSKLLDALALLTNNAPSEPEDAHEHGEGSASAATGAVLVKIGPYDKNSGDEADKPNVAFEGGGHRRFDLQDQEVASADLQADGGVSLNLNLD